MDQGETSVKIWRGFSQEWCLSQTLFNFYSKYLTKEACEGLGEIERGVPVIRTVKYSGDLVLLGEGETMLQGVIPRLIGVGIWYGMEMNVQNIYSKENLKATVSSTECDRS
jgi:hypothetical protein